MWWSGILLRCRATDVLYIQSTNQATHASILTGVAQNLFLEAQYFHHCRDCRCQGNGKALAPSMFRAGFEQLGKEESLQYHAISQCHKFQDIYHTLFSCYFTIDINPKQIGHMVSASSRSLHLPQVISLGHPLRWVSIHRTGSQKSWDLTRIANSALWPKSLVHHKLSPTYCGVPWWYHDGDTEKIFRVDSSKRWSKCHCIVTCN